MNHKRGRRKNARAGCLMCKPNKENAQKHSLKAKQKKMWQQTVRLGEEGGRAYHIGDPW